MTEDKGEDSSDVLTFPITYSNGINDVSLQREFISSILHPIHWILKYEMSTDQFLAYTGILDHEIHIQYPAAAGNQGSHSHDSFSGNNTSCEDLYGNNRASLLFVVNTLLGLVKRIEDKSLLSPAIIPYLKSLVGMICNLNQMWRPEMQLKTSPVIREKVFSPVSEVDKRHLLETPQVTKTEEKELSKSSGHRLQTFFWSMHENSFSLMGYALSCIPEPLDPDDLLQMMNCLKETEYLPRIKLKMILKTFLRPVILRYANEEMFQKKVILPLSTHFLPFIFRKIDSRWDLFKSSKGRGIVDGEREATPDQEEEVLEEELIEDQSNRILSREFIDLLRVMMLQNASPQSVSGDSGERGKSATPVDENNSCIISSETEMKDLTDHHQDPSSSAHISDLGRFLLQNNLNTIVLMSVVPLSWMDSVVSLKAALINQPLMEQLMREMVIKSREEIEFYLHHLFLALTYFDENDQNQTRILQLVLTLFEGMIRNQMGDEAKSPFWDLSHSQKVSWDHFEDSIRNKPLSDRKKRETLKILLKRVIGVSKYKLLCLSLS